MKLRVYVRRVRIYPNDCLVGSFDIYVDGEMKKNKIREGLAKEYPGCTFEIYPLSEWVTLDVEDLNWRYK